MKKKKISFQRTGFLASVDRFFVGSERFYFIQNFAILLSSGVDIMASLEGVKEQVRTKPMKRIISRIQMDIGDGSTIWLALQQTKMFPEHVVSLMRIGEESGRLTQNLKVIVEQQEKEQSFRSKVKSAAMYPMFVFGMAIIVAGGIAWFILPRLTGVFTQLKIDLPPITKALIAISVFFAEHGDIAIPGGILGIFLIMYLLFFYKRTRKIGQWLLFHTPGIKRLIQELQLSRFGYITGSLLEGGVPIDKSLHSLTAATGFSAYHKFFKSITERVEQGDSFQQAFASYKGVKKLVPAPMQQIIFAGEHSGHLPESFMQIGSIYEDKIETTTKNLSTIIEPILLIVVWLGVVGVALAVILPIYSLIGSLN